MPYTRFGLEGYGVRRAGSFAGKTESAPGRTVGIITRFGLEGYGVRRAGSFAGKTEAESGAQPVPEFIGLRANTNRLGWIR